MAKIRRHVPAFVDTNEEPETVEFSTAKELLEIPFVKNVYKKKFFQFSIADRSSSASLMAEYKKGKEWYVVGHMEDVDDIELPDWKPVYEE